MTQKKILRTELVAAGAALLCCLLLYGAAALIQTSPDISLLVLAALMPLAFAILPCALSWYGGRVCWTAPAILAVGVVLVSSVTMDGVAQEFLLAGALSGALAAAAEGLGLAARRGMPRTGWWAYAGLTMVYLFAGLLEGLLPAGAMAGIWVVTVACCLGITLLVFRVGRRVTFYPAAWMVVLFALQLGMTCWTLPFDLGRAALHFALVLVPQLLLTLVLLLRRPRAVQGSN